MVDKPGNYIIIGRGGGRARDNGDTMMIKGTKTRSDHVDNFCFGHSAQYNIMQ